MAMSSSSRARTRPFHRKANPFKSRSLSTTLLTCLIGYHVEIETDVGASYRGILDHVDSNMNVTLGDCVIREAPGKEERSSPLCYISGASIRYIDLSADNINVTTVMRNSWTQSRRHARDKRQIIVDRTTSQTEEREKRQRMNAAFELKQ